MATVLLAVHAPVAASGMEDDPIRGGKVLRSSIGLIGVPVPVEFDRRPRGDATLRRQQSVASRRPVRCARTRANRRRGIVPPAIFELFGQWRFTELPVSSAERSSERRGAELPKFAVIRPVFLARL